MKDTSRIDARPDQLKILKLEKRALRPMAETVLNGTTPKTLKLTAVSGVVAALLALQSAPAAYQEKLGITTDIASQSAIFIKNACARCDEIASLISKEENGERVYASLHKLFTLMDDEHVRLEKEAEKVGAKLLGENSAPRVTGSGGKERNGDWLQALKATGSGGKERNADWLQALKATGSGGKERNADWLQALQATGSGGKERNADWLQALQATGSGGKERNADWLQALNVNSADGETEKTKWLSLRKTSGRSSLR